MPKTKPYSTTLKRDLAIQLLNSSGKMVDGQLLGEALAEASTKLENLVKEANEFLETSEFAAIVAENLAKKANKRGHSQIQADDTGQLILDVSYEDPRKKKRTRTRRVPLLDELREEAKELGVDISQFGMKRREAYEYLQKVKAGDKPEAPKPETPKPEKAKAKSEKPKAEKAEPEPPKDEGTETSDNEPGPMSAGPDETRVAPVPDGPKPPKKSRGFVKRGDAVPTTALLADEGSKPAEKPRDRPNLRQLVDASEDVDISGLLSSEPPQK